MRAIDGINSAKCAWVEPKSRCKCSERNDPRASADNSGTVIKEQPSAPSSSHRDGECRNLQYRLCGQAGNIKPLPLRKKAVFPSPGRFHPMIGFE
jgi:hypothetical protein